ncbi:MAG: hypothetical protein EOO50_05235 [Flavobacterium sp.]|uniref:hypothetical protein n=1 Tax=Flavobacterium sp. TaxID=239 RepID=UPI0012129E27|nr:hypothetical protein [Flavobacterium sp.]RZJ67687.1 MAG: hypothetical protein EOO50_05235 [Flavobacterium sp.]
MFEEETKDVLHEEMERLRDDILKVYNSSGKRTTGEFERGLLTLYQPNQAFLFGYEYLGGRRAGKMPPLEAIEKWIKAKGLKPLEDKLSISSLAFLIARSIAKKGTKKENNLPIYTQVITPDRIQEILDKVEQINVSRFIKDVEAMITKSFNEFQ